MDFSDVDHLSTMLSGCESITSNQLGRPDAQYAVSVLKLHAADAGFVAGTEGFIEAIKKGAQKTGEWVVKLVKAIRDWLSGAWKKTVRWAKFAGNSDFVELLKTNTHAQIKNLEDFLVQGHTEDKIKGLKEFNVKLNTIETREAADSIHKELNKTGKLDEGRITRNFDKVMDNLKKDIETLNAAALVLSKDQDTDKKIAGEDAAYLSQSLSRHLNSLITAQERIAAKLSTAAPGKKDEDKKD